MPVVGHDAGEREFEQGYGRGVRRMDCGGERRSGRDDGPRKGRGGHFSAFAAPRTAQGRDTVPQDRLEVLSQLAAEDNAASCLPPRMLILVGIQGSGKSYFTEKLISEAEKKDGPRWVRVSQDVLGKRQLCEKAAITALEEGHSVVIDRCNFDKNQRKPWVKIADARGCVIGCIMFARDVDFCIERVNTRVGHESLPPGERSSAIVKQVASEIQLPSRDEGIDFCRYVREDKDVDPIIAEILEPPPVACNVEESEEN